MFPYVMRVTSSVYWLTAAKSESNSGWK